MDGNNERHDTSWFRATILLQSNGSLIVDYQKSIKMSHKELMLRSFENCSLRLFDKSDSLQGLEISNTEFMMAYSGFEYIMPLCYRFILPAASMQAFLKGLDSSCPNLNQREIVRLLPTNAAVNGSPESISSSKYKADFISLSRAMDLRRTMERKAGIKQRRGAFHCLPAFFSTDLIHGSWWYVVGSALCTVIALIVLVNNLVVDFFGNDDSILPHQAYDIAWGMLLASGVFFTIGSILFVRACNFPPLPPLKYLPCLSHEDVMGTWFFILAIFPALPYCFVYLVMHLYQRNHNIIW